ncbi:hypothetical protein QHI69_23910 [Burkholderia gladioli pv. gladioli]|uniref:hypothetical protein n=1 Tax=Burkholderia gladioli TaxID=28095 RepID=UPI0011875845|nr:hypothetical protein [Burkholderia gladioli]MDJ1164939.1 hypothetical protein [Burkholderia gladioli pv. gladioli]
MKGKPSGLRDFAVDFRFFSHNPVRFALNPRHRFACRHDGPPRAARVTTGGPDVSFMRINIKFLDFLFECATPQAAIKTAPSIETPA